MLKVSILNNGYKKGGSTAWPTCARSKELFAELLLLSQVLTSAQFACTMFGVLGVFVEEPTKKCCP